MSGYAPGPLQELKREEGECIVASTNNVGPWWTSMVGADTILTNNKIFDALAAVITVSDASAEEGHGHLRTELDSHANMPVAGQHAYILAESGKYVDVNPFTPH